MGSKSKPPPAPDYTALANQQAELNRQATEQQTQANRVNQVGPEGSLTWSKDAAGNWTQTEAYSPENQALRDAQRQQQQQLSDIGGGMLGGVRDAMGQPFDTSGMTNVQEWQGTALPDTSQMQNWGQVNLGDNPALADSGFGAVEGVRDAMMSRLRPGLQQGNEAEIARLKAQGITEGSPAWQAAMQSQGQRMNDAEQQALLGAAGEYGNIFNRSLQARQQMTNEDFRAAEYANQLRGQQFGEGQQMYGMGTQNELLGRAASTEDRSRQMQEALLQRQLPLAEYNQIKSAQGGIPGMDFESYFNQGNAGAADIYGAGDKQYASALEQYNAKKKASGGLLGGIGTAAGGVLGFMYGGPAGAAMGAKAGGALGGAIGGR